MKKIEVKGDLVDHETRCSHYHTERDIIAIKFYCCQTYYPCYQCHEHDATHEIKVWPKEAFHEKAILCGVCQNELTIYEYMNSNSTCPHCSSSFNPGCSRHYPLYFEASCTKK
ncbi:CHY zinc finger protein [Metabacillus iocasae]|uniref:CHY-type Zn-finger protein n=1 Tax=Priestia iocasae TaxID=2291674 RepID=A0ABS2QWQ0_9BACI|nr:CHY zinc finger protein [Metabacillus iocasae]MBM7703885.1 putative CHY-type Zn-finger protein [Metabacillus iocasae]